MSSLGRYIFAAVVALLGGLIVGLPWTAVMAAAAMMVAFVIVVAVALGSVS